MKAIYTNPFTGRINEIFGEVFETGQAFVKNVVVTKDGKRHLYDATMYPPSMISEFQKALIEQAALEAAQNQTE